MPRPESITNYLCFRTCLGAGEWLFLLLAGIQPFIKPQHQTSKAKEKARAERLAKEN